MTRQRICEAVWTLESGPLDSEETVGALFVAIGDVRHVEPARYDLNRRGQWKGYNGRRLIVDVLTQRTQLVTVAERDAVDEGGTLVVVTTGKQGAPPRASARWRQQWPPSEKQIEQWERAVDQAFSDLPLASFVLRVGAEFEGDPADGDVAMGASRRADDRDAIRNIAGSSGRAFGGGAVEGRTFVPETTGPAPEGWNAFWSNQSPTFNRENTDGSTSELG